MRKWFILGCVALVLSVAGTMLALLVSRPASAVNRVNTDRIQAGMTRAEVEAIYGGPPGDHRVGARLVTVDIGLEALPGNTVQQWRGDEGLAIVQFGPDGRVARADFFVTPRVELSLWDRIRLLMGF